MSEKKRILIIENQFHHYNCIKSSLKNDYAIFPKDSGDDPYNTFIDYVRVWVTGRYQIEKRDECFDRIKQYIIDNKIQLIICDVKLAGNHDGKNGIDLASKIVLIPELNLPVIFLTMTPKHDRKISDSLDGFMSNRMRPRFDWVFKGYAGDGLLDVDYFSLKSKEKIWLLLEESQEALAIEITELLTNIISDYGTILCEDYKEVLEAKRRDIHNSRCVHPIDETFFKSLNVFLNDSTNHNKKAQLAFYQKHYQNENV